MMEKIIVKHLHNYVLEHHIITEHQSGFQPKDSTVNHDATFSLGVKPPIQPIGA